MSSIIVEAQNKQNVTTKEILNKIPYFRDLLKDCENAKVISVNKDFETVKHILEYVRDEYYNLPDHCYAELDYLGMESNNVQFLKLKCDRVVQDNMEYILFINLALAKIKNNIGEIFKLLFGQEKRPKDQYNFIGKIRDNYPNVIIKILYNRNGGPKFVKEAQYYFDKVYKGDYMLLVPKFLINSEYSTKNDRHLMIRWKYSSGSIDVPNAYIIKGEEQVEKSLRARRSTDILSDLFEEIDTFLIKDENRNIGNLVFNS